MNLRPTILLVAVLGTPTILSACIWDADTLAHERKKSPTLAEAIIAPAPAAPDPIPLRTRIQKLKANPRESDPAWWNDLAGAYLRLGEPAEAARLLEPAVLKFPNDYGIHANLGTAYHLLGRNKDAEREIARDLEINPEGHFGLEKFHLALLQYLVRDPEYKKQHVYVDEFSHAFAEKNWDESGLMPPAWAEPQINDWQNVPAYRRKWNLATNNNFEEGVLYMATLNPREPACFVMLGVAMLARPGYERHLNLAIAAFEKAIHLGSPQAGLLAAHNASIRDHIRTAKTQQWGHYRVILLLVLAIMVCVYFLWRRSRKSKKSLPHSA